MILIANEEAEAGIYLAADMLKNKHAGIDALVEAISLVEKSEKVRSVGFGGWPNILGEMEFDASVMNGDTLETGAVGALKGILPAAKVAKAVMQNLSHQILVGEGATLFAKEMGFAEENTLMPDSKAKWQATLKAHLTEEELKNFPNIKLYEKQQLIQDPERVRDTTVFLCVDAAQTANTASSTSGWAWKYPGRLGDAPICGAGFYADSRFGAVACTHTGEMTIRAATSNTIINALRHGHSLNDAVEIGISDLRRLKTGYLGGVVIHAIDKFGNYKVANFRCGKDVNYWYWSPELEKPELRVAKQIKT
ncbi:MAG: N(4)-(beta-N-acetylglucosaminyl)-L-asparaginase [Rhizobiales bacterium]|nr:N(4)-(beta-N-acetylglucosaminyl)-L-asparaginase [Hyphomicrobiales bacterium]NRB13221.1 N(4)-(beta-N-acetylglucosaminyl)-L-asparaginase [Hyphomicrobiales bacterium]